MLGLKKCLLILKSAVSRFGQLISKQVKRLLSLRGIVKKECLYLKDALFLPLYSIIHTWLTLATMKQCFSHFQSISVSSYLKVIGMLMRVQLFQSLKENYTLLIALRSLTLGQSLGLAIMVMVVTLAFCGSP